MPCVEEIGAHNWKDAEVKAVSKRMRRYDRAQQAATGGLQKSVDYYKLLRDKVDRKDRARSRGSSGGTSTLRTSKKKCKREKYGVRVFCRPVHRNSACALSKLLCCSFKFCAG